MSATLTSQRYCLDDVDQAIEFCYAPSNSFDDIVRDLTATIGHPEINAFLYDKHYDEQNEVVDWLAERIQSLGGITLAMARTSPRRRSSPGPRRVARKCPDRSRGFCMPTKSS